MRVVTGIATRIVVLDRGVKLADGEPGAVMSDPAVRRRTWGVRPLLDVRKLSAYYGE